MIVAPLTLVYAAAAWLATGNGTRAECVLMNDVLRRSAELPLTLFRVADGR
jgi:hypothetical protein